MKRWRTIRKHCVSQKPLGKMISRIPSAQGSLYTKKDCLLLMSNNPTADFARGYSFRVANQPVALDDVIARVKFRRWNAMSSDYQFRAAPVSWWFVTTIAVCRCTFRRNLRQFLFV